MVVKVREQWEAFLIQLGLHFQATADTPKSPDCPTGLFSRFAIFLRSARDLRLCLFALRASVRDARCFAFEFLFAI